METETLDIPATNFTSSWPITNGSLEDAITSESSISASDSDAALTATLKPPLILRRPSPDSDPCEITISFTQQHEIKQIYVRSTARVYEIYYSTDEKGGNEYLCTVHCGVAAKSEELPQETDDLGSLSTGTCNPHISNCDAHSKSDSGGSTNEDDWVDVKVRNSSMLDEGTSLSKKDESCLQRGNQDFFEATAEISDADPVLSITLRLLSIQSGDSIYIDEVYVFADPVVSTDTNSPTNPDSSSESAKMSLLIPTLLSLSNFRRNQVQEQSDSAVGVRKHQDTVVRPTSTAVSSNTCQSEIQGTILNGASVQLSQPEFLMQRQDSQSNHNLTSEKNEFNCSRIEKTLDELVSRVAKLEDFFLRFEEKMVKPISNMEGRIERIEQQLESFSKTTGSMTACNRITAPDFSGIDSESNSIFYEENDSRGTRNSESIKKDKSCPPDMSIPTLDAYSYLSVLPNNVSSSTPNATQLIPSLVVTAPDFSYIDDEGENDLCEAVKDSPKGSPKKPLSINDALASALAGFLSSASKDTDMVEESADISSKEENGSPCPSESSNTIHSDEHIVSSVDIDGNDVSGKDNIVLTEQEFVVSGNGSEETTEPIESRNFVFDEGKSENSLDNSVILDKVKTDIDDSRLVGFGETDDDDTFIFGSTESPGSNTSTAALGAPAVNVDSCSGEETAKQCPGILLNILKSQSPAIVDFEIPILDVKFLSQENLSATSSLDALLVDAPDVCSEVPCVDEINATSFNGQHDLVMIEDANSTISETITNQFCLDDYHFGCIPSNSKDEGLQECGVQDMGASLI